MTHYTNEGWSGGKLMFFNLRDLNVFVLFYHWVIHLLAKSFLSGYNFNLTDSVRS